MSTAPSIKQGWLRVILFLIGYLLLTLFAATLVGLLVANYLSKPTALMQFAISILVSFLAGILAVWLFRKTIDRQSFKSLGLQWKGWGKEGISGFFTGILLITTMATALWLMRLLQWYIMDVDPMGMLLVTVLMILVSIGEELVFRGYILQNLMQSMSKEMALFVTALLFAGFHSLNPNFTLIAFLNIFIAGILLGINYIYTRNLWFAICLHFTWNYFQGPILGFQVSGLELPSLLQQNNRGGPLLTGGKFGLEASWLATVVMSLAIIILYTLFQRKYKTAPVQ